MSKIGVGIGEDFPADDTRSGEAPREGDRHDDSRARDDAEYAARREAYRKWREERSEWRRQWRDEWRARKRSFRAQVQRSVYETTGDYPRRRHHFVWGHGIVWAVLGLIAAIALISFIFSHIFVIVGVIAILALVAAYHRGYDPFDLPPRDYYSNTQPRQAPPVAPRDTAH